MILYRHQTGIKRVLCMFIFFTICYARELPRVSLVLEKVGYTVVYDTRNKVPAYVYQKFPQEEGSVKREYCRFLEDEDIPKSNRAKDSDYAGSSFDRGHMCPAADCTACREIMEESFLLSNIAPQEPKLNRGYWSKLERRVRNLSKECDSLEVFTGALYLPKIDVDGKKRVSYEVIGEGGVAVPTHFFKVLFLKRGESEEEIAYVLPNESIERGKDLKEFETTIENVQALSGVIFLNN